MTRRFHPEIQEAEVLHRHAQYSGAETRRQFERATANQPWAADRRTLWQRLSEAWKATPLWERRFILGNLAFWGGALAVTWWF